MDSSLHGRCHEGRCPEWVTRSVHHGDNGAFFSSLLLGRRKHIVVAIASSCVIVVGHPGATLPSRNSVGRFIGVVCFVAVRGFVAVVGVGAP